jgi:hypothetical protein
MHRNFTVLATKINLHSPGARVFSPKVTTVFLINRMGEYYVSMSIKLSLFADTRPDCSRVSFSIIQNEHRKASTAKSDRHRQMTINNTTHTHRFLATPHDELLSLTSYLLPVPETASSTSPLVSINSPGQAPSS